MPPRHGKSNFTSEYFPAWYLGNNPDKRIILASYEADFAASWGRKARRVMEEFGEALFGVKVSSSSSAADRWDIKGHTGGMNTAGVGGALTGKGGNCLSGESLVMTSIGEMTLEQVHQLENKPLVLSFNHVSGSIEYRQILHSVRYKVNEYISVQTAFGRNLRATGWHEVWADGKYTRADDLLGRERLKIIQREKLEHPGLDCTQVRIVSKNIHQNQVRIPEAGKERASRLLLQRRMLSQASFLQKSPKMSLWQTLSQENYEILFGGLSEAIRCGQKAETEGMSVLLDNVLAEKSPDCILQQGMRKQRTSLQDVREIKFKFQEWQSLSQTIQAPASFGQTEGWSSMCCVQVLREASSAPHRRKPAQQHVRKSCNSLRSLSCSTPQIGSDSVSVVEKLRTQGFDVYDIHVEGNHNYFANGILVHNCIIIDDPIKNSEDARSQVYRDKQWEWYRSTLYTRLEPGGSIILIETRWHEDDLAGRIIQEAKAGGEQWNQLDLPAIAKENDLLGRGPGEALWPERYPVEVLKRIEKTIGAYWFGALYQQEPAPEEGNIFKRHWWKFYQEQPGMDCFDLVVISADTAFKDLTTSDYVSLQVWGKANGKGNTIKGKAYLLDQIRSKIDGPSTVRAIKALKEKWEYVEAIYIEDKASGPVVVSTLKEQGIPGVIAVPVEKGKEVRASAYAIFVEAGDVILPDPKIFGNWVDVFIHEHSMFPNGQNDDQVDAAGQAVTKLLARRGGGVIQMDRREVV